MKIALCVSGAARLHLPALTSQQSFLKEHDVDTYCALWSRTAHSSGFIEGTEKEVQSLIELYVPKSTLIVPYTLDVKNLLDVTMKLNGIRMFYMIAKCDGLRARSGIDYDLVVRIRPDVSIRKWDTIHMEANTIVFPKTSVDELALQLYEDRMFYGPPDTIGQISNIFSWLQTLPKGSTSGYHEALFQYTRDKKIHVIVDKDLLIEGGNYLVRWNPNYTGRGK